MTIEQQQVKDFMIKFQQEVPSKPTMPNATIRRLAAELILEEALETIYALGYKFQPDEVPELVACDTVGTLEEIADGLGDTKYVVNWTASNCGIDLEPVEAEIHRSNMTKLWKYNEIGLAESIQCLVRLTSHKECLPPHMGDARYLVQDSRGKVIKSPSYSPANLKPIIERQVAEAMRPCTYKP